MPTKEIVITIRLQIDTDEDVRVDLATQAAGERAPTASGSENGQAQAIKAFVAENAPRALAEYQLEFLRRCGDELGLSVELPATSAPRTYLNLFPPKRYGAKRAGVLETRTGRVEIYCDPDNTQGRRFAEKITNNGVATAVKVYVKTSEAVDEAVDLTRIGLEER